jgi:short-subunit dehydrogenase
VTVLRGARALVTGANGGLGRAICRKLRAAGADLVVTGRRAEPTEEIAEEVGGRAVIADLAVRSELPRLLEEAGNIDVLVANAALPATGDLEDWTQADMDKALEVNLGNPIAMTRAYLPAFRRRGSGHFVFISSLSGKVGSRGTALYSATKFGLRGFASGLRCDLYGSGVGCSVIFPGFISDAGMYADSGVRLLPGIGTVTSDQVAKTVVRAIRNNRGELDVAPMPLRVATFIGAMVPNVSTVVQAKVAGRVTEDYARAQKDKR